MQERNKMHVPFSAFLKTNRVKLGRYLLHNEFIALHTFPVQVSVVQHAAFLFLSLLVHFYLIMWLCFQYETALGPTQPPIQWVPRALSLGVKRPGREADHSPPSSAEV